LFAGVTLALADRNPVLAGEPETAPTLSTALAAGRPVDVAIVERRGPARHQQSVHSRCGDAVHRGDPLVIGPARHGVPQVHQERPLGGLYWMPGSIPVEDLQAGNRAGPQHGDHPVVM